MAFTKLSLMVTVGVGKAFFCYSEVFPLLAWTAASYSPLWCLSRWKCKLLFPPVYLNCLLHRIQVTALCFLLSATKILPSSSTSKPKNFQTTLVAPSSDFKFLVVPSCVSVSLSLPELSSTASTWFSPSAIFHQHNRLVRTVHCSTLCSDISYRRNENGGLLKKYIQYSIDSCAVKLSWTIVLFLSYQYRYVCTIAQH